MSYQERAIPRENLEKLLRTLDSDEGIRIDEEPGHIFINKTSKRYCINITNANSDEFVYKNSPQEVMEFLQSMIKQTSKIIAY